MMRLDIYVQSADRKIDQLLAQGVDIMAKVTDLTQLVSDLNEETNAVAAKIDIQTTTIADLKRQIAEGTPVTQEQLDAVVDGLTPISDRLKAIGADAETPIPPAA